MSKSSSVDKLPHEVQRQITQALVDGSYESYDVLQKRLQEQGYSVSRSALGRFGKKLLGKYEIVKLAKTCSPEEENIRRETIRLRCLEMAKGDIHQAELYVNWVLQVD